MTGRRSAIARFGIVLVLAACSAPSPTRSGGEGLQAEQSDGDFRLVISTPEATWSEGEAIDVGAFLTYRGGPAEVTLSGSGSGVVGFAVEEVNGDKEMGAAWHDDCKTYKISQRDPITSPYRKSGGWAAEDPNAAFYQEFFAEPAFRLPHGRWKVTAVANFHVGARCPLDRKVDLRASLTITVV